MFKIDDFWKVFKYIYKSKNDEEINSDLEDLNSNIKAISLSEYSKASSLFRNTIDQVPFSSSDYRKLRSFLINWYAASKTLTKLQYDSLDLFSMTDENLDELFRSFGFNYSYSIRDFETKVNFFLDLVNIYKLKGTPTALRRVLSYYGMTDIVLMEYFLQLDKDNNLFFKPKPVSDIKTSNLDLNLSPLFFHDLTRLDPHWFQTESEVLQLFQENKISLPSKTPYFGIRPIYEFKSIEPVLTYFRRIIYDNIDSFINTGEIQERDIFIEKINLMVSVTELYLASIYCFNKVYGYSKSTDSRYIINDTSITDDYDSFKDEYNNVFKDIVNREDIPDRIDEYEDKLTRKTSDFYLDGKDNSIDLLKQINSEFFNEIDVWESSGRLSELIPYLIDNLNTWLEENIDTSFPDLTILTLGFDGLLETKDIINFFKPKRSRFLTLDVLYGFNDRAFDSIKTESKDFVLDSMTTEIRQFGRADNETSCSLPHQEMIYDCSYLFDAGLVDDARDIEILQYIENDGDKLYDELCDQNLNVDIYSNDDLPGSDIESIGVTNNFHHFDNDNFTFDERGQCYQESLNIIVQEI